MTLENPYRAAGAFAGKAYIRRGADVELVEQIRDNQYYPYFAAPRQSGKSSLIARTMGSLPAPEFRCALVDLSPFVVRSYDDFWRQFLHEVARSANFDPAAIGRDPRDVFMAWLSAFPGRLVIFVDEIDVLLHVECREQIFSKIRTFFNLRAHEPALLRLTFVLAGAAHSSRFISDPRWSPFNVAIEIALEDLTTAQVSQLASYLATAGTFAGPDLVARVYELTAGSVFLCQLVFEALWNRAARDKKKLEAADVDAVVASIVAESPRNIHFYNIFRLVTQDARLAMLFRRLVDGEELGEEDRKEIQLTGLCRGMDPFRNEVYARVFGAGGPLDLKVAGAKAALGRKLEAALTKRQLLAEEGATTSVVEAEIAALKREFREGAQLREGDVLARGRYRLIRQIGQGGFATVWQARDEPNRRDVALKVLHGQFAEDKTRRDRFFRGAWKMSELRHPAVVQVLEPYGEEAGRHFFVMEYMAGGTLHEAVLDRELDADAVIAGIVRVGQALAHAHERGLVHRDVKPSNVLLGEGGAAKLTDFDLVREQDSQGSTRTGPMGSFIYAAPEVLNRPQDADHRADIYGLAMTAVFGLHGAELPLEVVRDADRFIDRLRCGGLMKDVLKKGVAWELERRFASAAEFTQALATAWADKEVAPVAAEKQVAVETKSVVPTWTAMFATLPPPETGPFARPSPQPPDEPLALAAAPRAEAGGADAVARAATTSSATGLALATAPRVREVDAVARAATPPPPRATELALAAAPVAPGRSARREALDAALFADDSDDAAPRSDEEAAATASELALQAPTVAGKLADVDAPTRSMRPPTGAQRQPAAAAPLEAPQAPAERSRRGLLAALGLFATAALVLLALQIGGPGRSDGGERGVFESAASEAQAGVKKGEARTSEPAAPPEVPTKRDEPPPMATNAVAPLDPPPTTGGASPDAPETTTDAGPADDDASAEAGEAGESTDTKAPGPESETGGKSPPVEAKALETNGGEKRPPKKSLEARIDDGCFQVRARNAETGVKILQDAREDAPHNVELLTCLGDGLLKLGKYEAAEGYYRQLIAEYPRNKRGYLGAAMANESLVRNERAAKYYRQVLLLDPDNKSAQAFLASHAGAASKLPPGGGLDIPR